MRIFQRIEKVLSRASSTLLVVGVLVLLLVGVTQIALRNLVSGGLPWADSFMRHLVLWILFLGAIEATIENRHIRIDALTRVLPPRWRTMVNSLLYFISSLVLAALTFYSVRFVADEKLMGSTFYDLLPLWFLQIIIPVGFGILSVQFLIKGVLELGEQEQNLKLKSQNSKL